MFRSGPQPGSGWENQGHWRASDQPIRFKDLRSAEKMKEKNKWKVSVKRNERLERISRVASRRRKTCALTNQDEEKKNACLYCEH